MAAVYKGYFDPLGRKKVREIVLVLEYPADVFLAFKTAILHSAIGPWQVAGAETVTTRGHDLNSSPHYATQLQSLDKSDTKPVA